MVGYFRGLVPRMLRRTLVTAMAWSFYEQASGVPPSAALGLLGSLPFRTLRPLCSPCAARVRASEGTPGGICWHAKWRDSRGNSCVCNVAGV